jgi:hypothetical protein
MIARGVKARTSPINAPNMRAMPTNETLTVFISWSGELAKGVAQALREWLPNLYDQIAPWMSEEDIASGAKGLNEIHRSLTNAAFGIVVVTAENRESPWLNYEAGALSRSLGSSARVAPLLVDLASPSELVGPLAQFQARRFDRTGVGRLVETLSEVVGVPATTSQRRMELFWPELESVVSDLLLAGQSEKGEPKRTRPTEDIIDEILQRLRRLDAPPLRIPESVVERMEAVIDELERPPTPIELRDRSYVAKFVEVANDLRQIVVTLEGESLA